MAINIIFKSDDYISLPVPADSKSGDVLMVGDLAAVLVTDEGAGGNAAGYASVALEGGVRVNVEAGTAYAIGDTVYLTPTNVVTKTSAGNKRFGKVTHEAKTDTAGAGSVIVKIVQ